MTLTWELPTSVWSYVPFMPPKVPLLFVFDNLNYVTSGSGHTKPNGTPTLLSLNLVL